MKLVKNLIFVLFIFYQKSSITNAYEFIKTEMYYDNAIAACAQKGMRLAEIRNDQEYNEIVRVIAAHGKSFECVWLGGRRKNVNSKWLWNSNNETITYLKWKPSDPDNVSIHNCLSINVKQYDNRNCEYNRYSICETIPATPTSAPTTITPSTAKPSTTNPTTKISTTATSATAPTTTTSSTAKLTTTATTIICQFFITGIWFLFHSIIP